MTLEEIKNAIANGDTVHWSNSAYAVNKAANGGYLIKCTLNGHCIGLTWSDGVTLNGHESDFYISKG